MNFDKRDSSKLVKWWFNIDHAILFSVLLIIFIGVMMVNTSSPAVALKLDLDKSYFANRHLIFAIISIIIMVVFSSLSIHQLKRISLLGFSVVTIMLILLMLLEPSLKGAKRWLDLGPISLQPSELMKPFFIIINGWFLSRKFIRDDIPVYKVSLLLYLCVIGLIFMQPDLGMVINFSSIWIMQLFLSGIPLFFISIFALFCISGFAIAYNLFSHVRYRINSFLPGSGENSYQVSKSLEAIDSGGFFGSGIIEGTVKNYLPDSHTDFIFAVIVEEMGLIFTLGLIGIYCFIIFRSLIIVKKIEDNFIRIAVAGFATQIAFQVIVNIGVNINLLPTKGTTLPFISYGGSSMLSMGIMIGMLLAMSRNYYGKVLR